MRGGCIQNVGLPRATDARLRHGGLRVARPIRVKLRTCELERLHGPVRSTFASHALQQYTQSWVRQYRRHSHRADTVTCV